MPYLDLPSDRQINLNGAVGAVEEPGVVGVGVAAVADGTRNRRALRQFGASFRRRIRGDVADRSDVVIVVESLHFVLLSGVTAVLGDEGQSEAGRRYGGFARRRVN